MGKVAHTPRADACAEEMGGGVKLVALLAERAA
jgi:hypothetical protein